MFADRSAEWLWSAPVFVSVLCAITGRASDPESYTFSFVASLASKLVNQALGGPGFHG